MLRYCLKCCLPITDTVGLQFVNETKNDIIPARFIPSVEKGFKEAMQNGPLASYPLDSLKISTKRWRI